MASFSEHPNGIFSGHTFYVTQRVPNRKNILKTIEGNAGIIVKVEGSPAMTIVDDARPDVPWRAHSYKYILDSVSSGALQHEEKYMIQNMRPPKPIAPKKKGRIPFTDEDDKILLDRLRGRQNISGSQIYMEIEKEFPHHPWSAWRERFRKKLKPILEREGNVSRKYPRSQFHQSPQKVASNPEKKTILTTSPHVASGSATNTSRIVPPRPQSTAPVSTTTNLAQHGQTQASKKPVVTSIPQAPASIHREPSKSLEYHAPGLASPRPLSKKKFTSLPEAEDSISQPSVYTPEVQRATQLSKLVEDGEGIPNIHSNESPSILAQKVRTLSSQSKSKLWTIREEARLEEAVMEHVKNGGHWQDIEAYKKHAEKSKSKRHSWESSKRHFAELVRQKKVDMEEWFLDSQSATESQPPSPSPRPPLVPEVGPTVDNSSSAPEIHESDNDVEDERQSSRENSRSPDPQKYIGDSQWTAPKSMSEIDTEAQLLDSHMKTDPSCPIALDYKIDGQEVNFPDVFRAVMKQRLPPREVDWLTVAEHLAIDWVDGDAEDIVTQLKSYWNSSMPHCIRYLLQSEEASTEDQDDVEEKENKEDSKDGVYIDEGEEYDEEDENYEEEPDEDEERDEMKEEAQHEDALPELPKDSGAKENTNSQQDTKTGKNPTEPTVANISTSGLFCRSGTIPSSPKARPVSRQHKRPRPTNQRSSSPDMAVFESDSRNVVPVAKKHKTIAEPETQDFNIDVSPHDQIFSEFDFHSPIVGRSEPAEATTLPANQNTAPMTARPPASVFTVPQQEPIPRAPLERARAIQTPAAKIQAIQTQYVQQSSALPPRQPRRILPATFSSQGPTSSAPQRPALPDRSLNERQKPARRNRYRHKHGQTLHHPSSSVPRRPVASVFQPTPSSAVPTPSRPPPGQQEEYNPLQGFYELYTKQGYDGSSVKEALFVTTLNTGLITLTVLESIQAGKGIPSDKPGIWTHADDNDLRLYMRLSKPNLDGDLLGLHDFEEGYKKYNRLIKKHGQKQVDLRLDFLYNADSLGDLNKQVSL